MNLGDLHNFGRRVERIEREGRLFFRKPRPIVGELFLLGRNSPIKKLIFSRLKNQQSMDAWNSIFSIVGEPQFMQDNWSEGCGEIEGLVWLEKNELQELKNSSNEFAENFAFSFGIILGYAFVMGIKDLHSENFVITKDGIHVVDGEIGFEGIRSIHETNIVGCDKITRFMSGLSLFFVFNKKIPDLENLTETDFCIPPNLFAEVLRGFLEAVDILDSVKEDLKKLLSDFLIENESLPFRVLLRATYDYDAFMKYGEVPQIPFLESELTQMARGDIPYFFSTYEDRSIFYNADREGSKQVLRLPLLHPMWTALALKFRYDPELLLSENRFKTLRATGSIELMREINHELHEIKIGETCLKKQNGKVRYAYKDSLFEGDDCISHLDSNFHLSFGILEITQ